jgi:hypothetical protein
VRQVQVKEGVRSQQVRATNMAVCPTLTLLRGSSQAHQSSGLSITSVVGTSGESLAELALGLDDVKAQSAVAHGRSRGDDGSSEKQLHGHGR